MKYIKKGKKETIKIDMALMRYFCCISVVVLPVKGTQNITNNKSDNAKFMIRMLVVDRIIGLKATTAKINIKC